MTTRKLTAPARVVPEAKVHEVTCVGIDPGLSGAIAWIRPDQSAGGQVTPILEFTNGKKCLDRESLVVILQRFRGPLFVAIEKVNAAPMHGRRQGTSSMFNFGLGYGVWLGLLQAFGIEHVEVDPRRWKRIVLAGTSKDKAAAIGFARTFFPTVSLLATPRCRVSHDGMADALCLAEYARREWKTRQLLQGAKSC